MSLSRSRLWILILLWILDVGFTVVAEVIVSEIEREVSFQISPRFFKIGSFRFIWKTLT